MIHIDQTLTDRQSKVEYTTASGTLLRFVMDNRVKSKKESPTSGSLKSIWSTLIDLRQLHDDRQHEAKPATAPPIPVAFTIRHIIGRRKKQTLRTCSPKLDSKLLIHLSWLVEDREHVSKLSTCHSVQLKGVITDLVRDQEETPLYSSFKTVSKGGDDLVLADW